MSIKVALNHRTQYKYDRLTTLGPQIIRLRPAPHCRTPVTGYSLRVSPANHFVHWQQDPFGNYLARFTFPEPAEHLSIEVDLLADMTVVNPFDFFLEEAVEEWPFAYETALERELRPFLERCPDTPLLDAWVASVDRTKRRTVTLLVALNARLQQEIAYLIRLEPGVQTPEETLSSGRGSCRDSAWLLVQILRRLGLAARFASGYLIQLTADQKSLDGPSGPEVDFTDLHAWAEVYLPGAGWIGLDPTSGLFAGEGHIPLACTPDPQSASPISGALSPCEVTFDFRMKVTRAIERPRVTKPYTDEAWAAVEKLAGRIDARLAADDVRLTMGGEPTFVSIDDMDGAEWTVAAVGPRKRVLSEQLVRKMRERFSPGGLLHFGQGKWYPGEQLPRWALACYWRRDGEPVWKDPALIAEAGKSYGHTHKEAQQFITRLAEKLEVPGTWIAPVYEDVGYYLWKEQKLPDNVTPLNSKLEDAEERARLARVFGRGVTVATGFLLPLEQDEPLVPQKIQPQQGRWRSGPWPVRADKLYLLPGDSPVGLRLPLGSLPWESSSTPPRWVENDPTAVTGPLPPRERLGAARHQPGITVPPEQPSIEGAMVAPGQRVNEQSLKTGGAPTRVDANGDTVIRTALCVEARNGVLHVFMPPVRDLDGYLDLVAAVENTAAELGMPVIVEGYTPPHDHRLMEVKVTPDPGVIEVNIHPSSNWQELSSRTQTLYADARETRLGTEKFDLDGRHTGTGGGNHVVLGGKSPLDSPFLRRPDLLRSMIAYWNNHPSLSYLFSGRFIGPTSQAPRLDEGRADSLYEMAIAFSQIPDAGEPCPPWLVDRVFRNLLVDLTGNTHRAEFCIDKLYSPDSSSGRLGLVELRALEMPPHAEMSLAQQLLIRGMIAWFWRHPYREPLVHWRTSLHDQFMLPHFVMTDFKQVMADLTADDMPFRAEWFAAHSEFRFPLVGHASYQGIDLELRTAIEPWYVLGEESGGGGTVRFVDSSVERLQVLVRGMVEGRHAVTVNGRRVPLTSTGTRGEYVGGVRFRAWQPPSCLHPNILVHAPLTFDILDGWVERSIGGCTYRVSHPAGRNYDSFPINSNEAEARRAARFSAMGHTPGHIPTPPLEPNPDFPLTLDLRRPAP